MYLLAAFAFWISAMSRLASSVLGDDGMIWLWIARSDVTVVRWTGQAHVPLAPLKALQNDIACNIM
jgi:hypothetical protein